MSYFHNHRESNDMVADLILQNGRVGSHGKGWPIEEIYASLTTSEPHYGDGAYVTFHAALNNAHPEVKRHHGLSVANRSHRAVLEIVKPETLQRILRTGGIGIKPALQGTLEDMIWLEPPEIKVLRIERLRGDGQWIP